MASKGLTECCRGTMAAKPSDWRLMGVVSGPRELNPKICNTEEVRLGAGPKGERLMDEGPGRRMRRSRSRYASRG